MRPLAHLAALAGAALCLAPSLRAQPAPTPKPAAPVTVKPAPVLRPPAPPELTGPPLVLPIEHRTAPGDESSAARPAAGAGIDRPSFAGRQVSVFDFEEEAFNPEEVPRYWFRAQDAQGAPRKGFPRWNQALLDDRMARSGKWSVKLPTKGGSTSLRLGSRHIQVFPDAEYRVSCAIRTEGLRHAGALIEAAILDENGEPIPGAVVRSQPMQSGDSWTPVAVTLHGPFVGARSLRIDLLLLQPDQFPVTRVAEQFVPRPEDLSGAAYFDDVAVIQLPRVRLTTTAPGNVFVGASAKPTLTAQVRDLTGEDLHAEIITRDINDAIVDRQEIALGRGGAKERIVPRLTKCGWYSVSMHLTKVSNFNTEAGQLARTSLLWLNDAPRDGAEERAVGAAAISPFALLAENPNPWQLQTVWDLAALVRVSRLTAPGSLDPPLPDGKGGGARTPLEDMLNSATTGSAELAVGVYALPSSLADRLRLEAADVLSLGGVPPSEWLNLFVERYGPIGPRVGSWQIGTLDSVRPGDDARLLAMVAGLRTGIHKFSPNPRLVLPWRADQQWLGTPRTGGTKGRPFNAVNVLFPSSFAATEIPRAVASLQAIRDEGLELTIVPESLPPAEFGVRAEMNDWAQRAVLLWAASQPGPGQPRPRIGLRDPWDPAVADRSGLIPRPTLAALATLNRAVAGRRVAGEVPAGPHVHGLILAPEEGGPAIGSLAIGFGGLIAWTDAGDDATDSIAGYSGGGTLTLIDLFGNRTPIHAEPGTGRHVIPVTGSPVIVEGIDAHLVKFIADVRISPAFIPAVVATHDCEIILRNPWSTRITGDVQLIPPEAGARAQRDWSFAPSTPIAFSIAPGQTARLPFSFIFSSVEEAGAKPIQLLVRLSADRPYPPMRIGKSITVGLQDLDLNVTANLGPREDGPNVIITTTVTNSGRLTRTLQLSSHAAGFATQSQPIVDLAPGETAIRRFILNNGAEALAGRRIRVLLVDVDGAERLNKYAVVPN
ncbi:MAG TPA: hypothetical protein VFF65_09815 [Phycisphaerales bacterium]|nr:hypothetical protein [Phycisphaerales bacterium]